VAAVARVTVDSAVRGPASARFLLFSRGCPSVIGSLRVGLRGYHGMGLFFLGAGLSRTDGVEHSDRGSVQ
jgi:hypothetical protein